MEEKLKQNYGITRVWYIPILSLILLLSISFIDKQTITSVFVEKIDIIFLILSFAVLSEGMRTSNIFSYLASRISDYSNSSYQLLMYICLGTSLITIFTSNDIVVIALTPITVQICVQSGVQNLRLVLLSQFVIANTLSMTTYIGSPTNIIFSEELGIDFLQYLRYMGIPSIVSFVTTLCIIYTFSKIAKQDNRYLNKFEMDTSLEGEYEPKETEFTPDMLFWILLFIISVLAVAFLTILDINLLWCALPTLIISLFYLRTKTEDTEVTDFQRLPYGILFFGMSFFIIGESLVSTELTKSQVIPLLQSLVDMNTGISILSSIFLTGAIVNVFNDLPAATIVSPIFTQLVFESEAQKIVMTKGVLIGLNIGKYITQIGALAGIAWFSQIGREINEQYIDIKIPSNRSLLIFGVINFAITGLILSFYLILEYVFLTSVI